MENVQSRRGSLAVLSVLIIAAGILATSYLHGGDRIERKFDIACHTPGEVPQECDEMFTDVPMCGEEDCSDQWPLSGYHIDPTTGVMRYQVPDTPIRDASQKAG